jgi:hypothetical protein
MWSWLPQKGRSGAISHRLALLLLVLVITAKPEDWSGSRTGKRSSVPDNQRWRYICTMDECHASRSFPEEQVVLPRCSRHSVEVAMKLDRNPEAD